MRLTVEGAPHPAGDRRRADRPRAGDLGAGPAFPGPRALTARDLGSLRPRGTAGGLVAVGLGGAGSAPDSARQQPVERRERIPARPLLLDRHTGRHAARRAPTRGAGRRPADGHGGRDRGLRRLPGDRRKYRARARVHQEPRRGHAPGQAPARQRVLHLADRARELRRTGDRVRLHARIHGGAPASPRRGPVRPWTGRSDRLVRAHGARRGGGGHPGARRDPRHRARRFAADEADRRRPGGDRARGRLRRDAPRGRRRSVRQAPRREPQQSLRRLLAEGALQDLGAHAQEGRAQPRGDGHRARSGAPRSRAAAARPSSPTTAT